MFSSDPRTLDCSAFCARTLSWICRRFSNACLGSLCIEQRTFGAFQCDRRELAQWAQQFEPEVVVMESTGVY